jgi:hypothetical protein
MKTQRDNDVLNCIVGLCIWSCVAAGLTSPGRAWGRQGKDEVLLEMNCEDHVDDCQAESALKTRRYDMLYRGTRLCKGTRSHNYFKRPQQWLEYNKSSYVDDSNSYWLSTPHVYLVLF